MAKNQWKLVRDNIPNIMESEGKTPTTRVLDLESSTYSRALTKKLNEEVKELKKELDDNNHENIQNELCDVLEVLACIASNRGLDLNTLFNNAEAKRKERGSFTQGIELKL